MDLQQLVQDVLDGNESGLVALAVLKEEQQIIKDCIAQIESVAAEEAAQYTEKTFQFKDLMVEKRAGGRMYNFKNIPEWNKAKAEVKAIEERAKAAFSSYEKGLLTADQDGVEIELPAVTYKKDSLIIKRIKP